MAGFFQTTLALTKDTHLWIIERAQKSMLERTNGDKARRAKWEQEALFCFLEGCRRTLKLPSAEQAEELTALKTWLGLIQTEPQLLTFTAMYPGVTGDVWGYIAAWQFYWFRMIGRAVELLMNRTENPDETKSPYDMLLEHRKVVQSDMETTFNINQKNGMNKKAVKAIRLLPDAMYGDLINQLNGSSDETIETFAKFPEIVDKAASKTTSHQFRVYSVNTHETPAETCVVFPDPSQILWRTMDEDFAGVFRDVAYLANQESIEKDRLQEARVRIEPVPEGERKLVFLTGNSAGGALQNVIMRFLKTRISDENEFASFAIREPNYPNPTGDTYPIGEISLKILEVAKPEHRSLHARHAPLLRISVRQKPDHGVSEDWIEHRALELGITIKREEHTRDSWLNPSDGDAEAFLSQSFWTQDAILPSLPPSYIDRAKQQAELQSFVEQNDRRVGILYGWRGGGKSEIFHWLSERIYRASPQKFAYGVLIDLAQTAAVADWPQLLCQGFAQHLPDLMDGSLPLAGEITDITNEQWKDHFHHLFSAVQKTRKRYLIVFENAEELFDSHGGANDQRIITLLQRLALHDHGIHCLLLSKMKPMLPEEIWGRLQFVEVDGLPTEDAIRFFRGLLENDPDMRIVIDKLLPDEAKAQEFVRRAYCLPGLLKNLAGRLRLNAGLTIEELLNPLAQSGIAPTQNPDPYQSICTHFCAMDADQQNAALMLAALRRPVQDLQFHQAIEQYYSSIGRDYKLREAQESLRSLRHFYFLKYDDSQCAFALPPPHLDVLTQLLENAWKNHKE